MKLSLNIETLHHSFLRDGVKVSGAGGISLM